MKYLLFLIFKKIIDFKFIHEVCIIKFSKQRQIYKNMSTPPPETILYTVRVYVPYWGPKKGEQKVPT